MFYTYKSLQSYDYANKMQKKNNKMLLCIGNSANFVGKYT